MKLSLTMDLLQETKRAQNQSGVCNHTQQLMLSQMSSNIGSLGTKL